MASEITVNSTICSTPCWTVCSDQHHIKPQSFTWSVNSPTKTKNEETVSIWWCRGQTYSDCWNSLCIRVYQYFSSLQRHRVPEFQLEVLRRPWQWWHISTEWNGINISVDQNARSHSSRKCWKRYSVSDSRRFVITIFWVTVKTSNQNVKPKRFSPRYTEQRTRHL